MQVVDNLVRSGAVDMIVVDSVAALTPRAEIEGEIGSVLGASLVRSLHCYKSINLMMPGGCRVSAFKFGTNGRGLFARSRCSGAAHEPRAAEDHRQRVQVPYDHHLPQPAAHEGDASLRSCHACRLQWFHLDVEGGTAVLRNHGPE